jgi:hypothetical protein
MIAMAAKAKYAGLKGTSVLLHPESKLGSEEVFRFPCPVGAGETLGGEKRLFSGEIRGPGCKPHRDTTRMRSAEPIKKQNNR